LGGQSIDLSLSGFPRQALHAERLRFNHPVSGRAMEFHAPPPADMRRLVKRLDELRALFNERAKRG